MNASTSCVADPGFNTSTLTVAPLPSEQLRHEFLNRLNDFKGAYLDYDRACERISREIGGDVPCESALEAIEAMFASWLGEICEDFDVSCKNVGHISISTDRLPPKLARLGLRDACEQDAVTAAGVLKGVRVWEAGAEQLTELASMFYPVDELHKRLCNELVSIENAGFADAATKLGRDFGLLPYGCRNNPNPEGVEIKRACGRYILTCHNNSSYSFERVRALSGYRELAQTMEHETGVAGFVDCLSAALGQEKIVDGLSGMNRVVPSRTKVCEGEPVEAVFFLGKIKFRFDQDSFEAFVGFVREHAADTLPPLVMS